ncbi:hypothetical protein CCR91_10685 [Thiorhodovibrio winogradskyi]|nr:hypothetical protein [Thiorhodovibrio winogradskyi]
MVAIPSAGAPEVKLRLAKRLRPGDGQVETATIVVAGVITQPQIAINTQPLRQRLPQPERELRKAQ